MKSVSRISLALKALRELGPRELGLYAWYQIGLKSGYFHWRTRKGRRKKTVTGLQSSVIRPILNLPDPDAIIAIIGSDGLSHLKAEADEIVDGRVRLFGGSPVPLELTPPGELTHWTEYEKGNAGNPENRGDIKFIWEPARFSWAFILGRAYSLTEDERYPEAFWHFFETFTNANPVNEGPNWLSAQEVSFRIVAFSLISFA